VSKADAKRRFDTLLPDSVFQTHGDAPRPQGGRKKTTVSRYQRAGRFVDAHPFYFPRLDVGLAFGTRHRALHVPAAESALTRVQVGLIHRREGRHAPQQHRPEIYDQFSRKRNFGIET
jgi:hypothetical protein